MQSVYFGPAAFILFVLMSSALTASDDLSQRLRPLIDAHHGRVAVGVEHLESGQKFHYHEDEVFPTASLIKFPVMIELYRQAGEHKVDLNKRLTLHAED